MIEKWKKENEKGKIIQLHTEQNRTIKTWYNSTDNKLRDMANDVIPNSFYANIMVKNAIEKKIKEIQLGQVIWI